MNKELKHIITEIKRVAKDLGVHTSQLTQAQLLENSDVKEWDIRKRGGLSAIRNAYLPTTGKELKDIHSQREAASYIRKLEKQLAERQLFEERITREVTEAITKLPLAKIEVPKPLVTRNRPDMTVELMLSDIHYGKLTQGTKPFNLSIARARIRHVVSVLLKEIEQHQTLFNVERLIVAVIGDVIESYTMHGLESAIGCEFNNPRQVDEAVESLWFDVVVPLAKTGLKIDFVGVTGNHDRTEPKRTMNKPGVNQLTWIIYKGLERLAKVAGLKNVAFYIPDEAFVVLPIYNNWALYEHTDNAAACDQRSFELLMQKRGKQVGKQIDFLRAGHWHTLMMFDRGRIIVNESVAGQDGYAETMGFNSSAGQTINFYIKTDVRKTCFYKTFGVALEHIGADSENSSSDKRTGRTG